MNIVFFFYDRRLGASFNTVKTTKTTIKNLNLSLSIYKLLLNMSLLLNTFILTQTWSIYCYYLDLRSLNVDSDRLHSLYSFLSMLIFHFVRPRLTDVLHVPEPAYSLS